jgi:predicted nucleotidyltransferase
MEERLRAFFEAGPREAVAAYLFGSFARGEQRPSSDVDVAVLYRALPPSTLDAPQFALEADLEQMLGRDVQVIVLDTASPDLVHRVLRDGKVVLDRDPSARIAFEVWARNEYFDIEPVLRRYRRPSERSP